MLQNQNKTMILLSKKDVSLKGYKYMCNKILSDYKERSIFFKIIEYADIILKNCIKRGNLPLYKSSQNLLRTQQKRVDVYQGKDYITTKDEYYGVVKRYRDYNALVYLIRCKNNFPDNWFNNKRYFGYTHSTESIRFKTHIQEAIEQYIDYQKGCRREIPTKLNRAIIIAIEDIGYSISEINNFFHFENEYSQSRMLENLAYDLEDNYFDVIDLAYHKKLETAINQEIELIHKYDTTSELNVLGGGQGGLPYIPLPFYDIVGLIAIGCSQKKIWKLLNKLYGNDFINSSIAENTLRRRIIEEFLDWVNAQKLFLKPVIEALVYEGFSYQKIYNTFSSPHSKEGWLYKWWKKEEKLDFKFWLRLKVLDVNKIRTILNNLEDKYCGIPKSQWVEWVKKEVPNYKIAEISGLPFNTIVSVYKHNFGGRNGILFKYRRNVTIKMRKKGMSLKNIYTIIFKKPYDASNYKRDFKTWFNGMTPEEIEETWVPDEN